MKWCSETAASLTMALTLMIGSVAPAHAVLYSGSWDPTFGSAYPDLGFSVEVTVFVPTACDHTSGSFIVGNFGSGAPTSLNCAGQADVQSAEVTLYQLSNPSNTKLLDFSGLLTLLGLQFAGGDLTGILATPSSTWLSSSPFGPSNGDSFNLGFGFLQGPILVGRHLVCDDDDFHSWSDSECNFKYFVNDFTQFPPILEGGHFDRVPEPDSAALAAAALLALSWIAARRGRRQGSPG